MTNDTKLRIAYRTLFGGMILSYLFNTQWPAAIVMAFLVQYRLSAQYQTDKARFFAWARKPMKFDMLQTGFALLFVGFFIVIYMIAVG